MKCSNCGHWSFFNFVICRKCGYDINNSKLASKSFTENDNLGTRYDTESLATSYFISRRRGILLYIKMFLVE